MVNGAGLEPATTGLKGKCTRVGGVCIGVSVHGFYGGGAEGGVLSGERGQSCAGGVGGCQACRMTAPAGGGAGKVQAWGGTRNVPEATRRRGAQADGGGSWESGGKEKDGPHTDSQRRGEQREPAS